MLAALLLALVSFPAALAPCQERAPLLSAPAGWATERLPFPLDFAPELPYRGFEDLAFAPGMFSKGSDSYFSYALALELEGDVAIDAAFLADFLATYYRGLCRAVGEARQLELDLTAVSARVEGGGERFRAVVEAFDPFTDGGALKLTLELRTHARAGRTELVGIASPSAGAAPIWKELEGILADWTRARPAALYLNHVFWIVDRATYEALRAEPFLRELAVLEERTTVRPDMSYTGLYLYGRRTYLEFLAADEASGFSAGQSGLAFGLERAGATDELAAALRQADVRSMVLPVARAQGGPDGGQNVPWFTMLGLEMPPGPLQVFALEYDPRFLPQWHPELPARAASLARADVLARYAEALGQKPATTLLGDVAALDLALDAAQRERLVAALTVAGYETHEAHESLRVEGPGLRLVLGTREQPGGLTRCELALTREVRREPLVLGKVRLSFAGARAELTVSP